MDIIKQAKKQPTTDQIAYFEILGDDFNDFCDHLPTVPNITTVMFERVQFKNDVLTNLKCAILSSSITHIHFKKCQLDQCLPCIQETGKITGLTLTLCTHSKASLQALRMMMPYLHYFTCDSGNCCFDIVQILKEEKHDQLRELRLLNLLPDDTPSYNIAELFRINPGTSLESLTICYNSINENDFIHLLDAIQTNKNKVRKLCAGFNHITKQSTSYILQCLCSSFFLTDFYVFGVDIPGKDMKRIRDLCDRKESKSFKAISMICAAKKHPHLALKGCCIHLLPYELIKKINFTMNLVD